MLFEYNILLFGLSPLPTDTECRCKITVRTRVSCHGDSQGVQNAPLPCSSFVNKQVNGKRLLSLKCHLKQLGLVQIAMYPPQISTLIASHITHHNTHALRQIHKHANKPLGRNNVATDTSDIFCAALDCSHQNSCKGHLECLLVLNRLGLYISKYSIEFKIYVVLEFRQVNVLKIQSSAQIEASKSILSLRYMILDSPSEYFVC